MANTVRVVMTGRIVAASRFAVRLFGDVAGLGECPLGHHRAKDLIDENGEEDGKADGVTDLCAAEQAVTCHGIDHAEAK